MPKYYLLAIDEKGLEGINGAIIYYQFREDKEITNLGIKLVEEDVEDGVPLRSWADSKLHG
jgi:hypothetical protein